jgi:hypothetical protein
MTVFICGNSHVIALKQPYERIRRDWPEPRLRIFNAAGGHKEVEGPLSTVRDNRVRFLSEKQVAKLKTNIGKPYFENGDLEDVWGVSIGHHPYVWGASAWGLAEPSAICRPGTQPVSAAALSTIISYHQRHFRDFLYQLKSIGLRLFVISCPFPRSDHPKIVNGRVRRETVLHIDQAARMAFGDWLADQGIDLIDPPPECRTAEGFLRPEFRLLINPLNDLPDHSHGNDAYGVLMLRRIFAYLKTGDPDA